MTRELILDANHAWLDSFAAEHGGRHIVSFSLGKDAIASWLVLRKHDIDCVPYYLYLVPDLEFVEESIRYFEGYFSQPIMRLPHPSLFRMIDNAVFQPPERISVIDDLNPIRIKYEDIYDAVRGEHGLTRQSLIASGVRAADSIVRRLSFQRHGHIRKDCFYPVWNFRKKDIYALMGAEGVKLPIDYEVFGRSFDGIDARFLVPIKQHFPRDYERILEWFPLADLEVFRYEHF